MGNILRSPATNNAIHLTPRSASHSLARAALTAWWPETVIDNPLKHPAAFLPIQENWTGDNENVALVVRNPVERFRSMVAHRHLDVDEQLSQPMYGPLPTGPFVRYFRFETQMDECADWLGLPVPLIHEGVTDPADKPSLTPDQEARVRELFAADIALWESLQ